MGILSRFRDIMASNMNALLDKAEDPEKTMDRFMRNLNSDLGNVKAEMATVISDESRAKRALDECTAEIHKLQRYAEKAVEAGNEDDARRFLEKKATLAPKKAQLQASYDSASSNVAATKEMHDKLVSDIGELEARHANLKGKSAAAKVQQRLNSLNGTKDAVFGKMEEKIQTSYDEAKALAELRAGTNDDLDELFAQYEKEASMNAEDELAAIKERMNKKD